ncbi:MAG: hypothetical protein JSS33_02455 [Proteobacteria bacterium]|nr:hypothetical protein [Pseudomonadota bacterium]
MKSVRSKLIVSAIVAVLTPLCAFANWNAAPKPSATTASTVCTNFSGISFTGAVAPGATNGMVGTPQVGEIYTITVSGPGTGSFRIVGDAAGALTYAGPASVPGALSYAITASTTLSQGVGYYFDSGSGTVTLTAACVATAATPALGAWGIVGLASLLALLGLGFGQYKRSKEST